MLKKLSSDRAQRLYLFIIISIWFMGFCSYTSPLYYFDYSPDNNAFFTVGKAMMHGITPYKDLFEQKGPYLYFIHGIASLIANHSLMGMFPFEVLSLTMTIWFTYKIALLFLNDTKATMVSIFSPFLYLIHPYFNYGDTTESLLFPLTIYLIYLVIKNEHLAVKDERKRLTFSSFEWGSLGLSVAVIFLSKYTQLGGFIFFYLFVFFYYLFQKRFQALLQMIIPSLIGFLIGIVPWFIYFILTGSLAAFFHVYFYENIVVYGNSQMPIFSNLVQAITVYSNFIKADPVIFILGFVGVGYVLLSKSIFKTLLGKSLFMTLNIGNAILAVYGYTNTSAYLYYELAFMPYLLVPVIAVMTNFLNRYNDEKTLTGKHLENKQTALVLTCALLSFLLVLGVNDNFLSSKFFPNNSSVTLSYKQGAYQPAQVVFGKIIRQQTGEKTSLLNFGSIDMGFYTASGVMPSEYYFQNYNIAQSDHPQIIDSQIRSIMNRKTEWVVLDTLSGVSIKHWNGATGNQGKITAGNLNTGTSKIYPVLNKNYYVVAKHDQNFESVNVSYWLLRRRKHPLSGVHISKNANAYVMDGKQSSNKPNNNDNDNGNVSDKNNQTVQ